MIGNRINQMSISQSEYHSIRSKILKAKTPKEFVEKLFKSNLSQPQKSWTTIFWRRKTGFTKEDIQKARKDNPGYKKRIKEIQKNSTYKRIQANNFSKNGKKCHWDDNKYSLFFDLQKKGAVDSELARTFETTIPAIYSIRRKLRYSEKILSYSKKPLTKKNILLKAKDTEINLRHEYQDLYGLKRKTKLKKLK